MIDISTDGLARALNGRIVGRGSPVSAIAGTCPIDRYVPGKVTFVRSQRYAQRLETLQGAVVLIPESFSDLPEEYPLNVYIVIKDVAKAMVETQALFYSNEYPVGELRVWRNSNDESGRPLFGGAHLSEDVYLGKGVCIGKGTRIMPHTALFDNVRIGDNTVIEPGVTIYRNCEIGNGCLIGSGARIGADGFRVLQDTEHHTIYRMIHAGHVVVGDRVEIGCNSTVCRSTFVDKPTVISDDVKISHQVDVGHNVQIGARTSIAPQTCIGGSARIGEEVWIGVGVVVSNDVTVGNAAKILLNAVVAYDVPDREVVSGFYAMPHRQWKRAWEALTKMTHM